jgi:Zn-finger nucleic acid-binding protein
MSIRFKCPNGHELNVKEKYAGLTGLCPRCQVRVLVPSPVAALTDDAIVDLLGPPPAEDPELPVHQDLVHRPDSPSDAGSSSGASLLGASQLSRGMKVCPKCKREVRLVYDICPHCRTYFTDVAEVNRRMALTCKHCGTEYEHHRIVIWCEKCGADLRQQH